ncbi:hypothetical protein [Pelomonas sp. Root1444]|uniref:hypothetical protein n=1 Tax=Pelomonas sp. Root1444 TaxID=1736464 RepID=UPI000703089C|nr:hypothetical protein [Pelomonas sp. Root1444]KQY90761.1 hypothetical protein ASD35_02850 [Pelomonas sp. Root1444]
MAIWQQGAGDLDRNYAALCIQWGVILNGPGRFGPFPQCAPAVTAGASSRKSLDLRRFAVDMKDGDTVLLRMGTKEVLAVGVIVGDYEWHDGFSDVDGWDLQHVRRVSWYWHRLEDPQAFDTYELKQGDTTQLLAESALRVRAWLTTIFVPSSLPRLPDLPPSGNSMSMDDVSAHLFDHGVASGAIAQLLEDVGELVRIGTWYARTKPPSEHETVAFLVLPLMRSLGWTPQKMGVEWNHIDVALFNRLPRSDENLCVVVEAKRMNNSCLTAHAQAVGYAKSRSSCERLILTDGLRYAVYTVVDGEFKLHAYLNLASLRDSYPLLECGGAQAAMLAMAPEWKAYPVVTRTSAPPVSVLP